MVAIIAPWNYPLTMAVSDAIPALLAGNAVLLKPAELTPFAALYAVQLLREAGLPDDLFHVLTGRGRDIGATLITASDFLCFTGSTETGRDVACQAGENLIKCSLELGGKNPMIVLDDADLGRAVHGAIQGCFSSAGQLCISLSASTCKAASSTASWRRSRAGPPPCASARRWTTRSTWDR